MGCTESREQLEQLEHDEFVRQMIAKHKHSSRYLKYLFAEEWRRVLQLDAERRLHADELFDTCRLLIHHLRDPVLSALFSQCMIQFQTMQANRFNRHYRYPVDCIYDPITEYINQAYTPELKRG